MGDRRDNSCKIYVGNLPRDVRESDIWKLVEDAKFRANRVDLKQGFGFIQFDDPRDMDDAIREFDGQDFMGSRLRVEQARGGAPREPGDGRCFKCGNEGHWARDCPEEGGGGERRGGGACYSCGEMGHLARDCPNPRGGRSRSPPRRRYRSRSRSPPRRRRSYSRSPSPYAKRHRSRSRSPRRRSPSPRRKSPSPRRRSPSPRRRSPSPRGRSPPPRSPPHNRSPGPYQ